MNRSISGQLTPTSRFDPLEYLWSTLTIGYITIALSNYVAFFYANRLVTILNSHRICSLPNALARAPSYRALKSLMSKDSQNGTNFFGGAKGFESPF